MSKIGEGHSASGLVVGLTGSASLRTPCGGRRAENIRKGDLIVTRDNGLQAVRMVWTRTVTEAEIAADPSLAPVRLKPRSIGPMMPQRDLLVAPDHKVLVPGYRLADMPDTASYLIAARDVADASDEAFQDRGQGDVTYYNIVFDSHQVFCVDGLPVESYMPSEQTVRTLDEATRADLEATLRATPDDFVPEAATKYVLPEAEHYRPEFV
ncbi:MAG: Hint domain-containing protein [Pseudomonadota bacterium]